MPYIINRMLIAIFKYIITYAETNENKDKF